MTTKERIGKNIHHYRKLKGITLKEIAQKVGRTEAVIQKYEAAKIKTVDIEIIANIAKAIGVSPLQIVGWD